MTGILPILTTAAQAGISFTLNGDEVALAATIEPPADVLTILRRHREEVVAWLRHAGPLHAEYLRVLATGPLPDMPAHCWDQFKIDADLFLRDWSKAAFALGWSAADIFGHDIGAPWQRIDKLGLVWLLNGGRIAAIDEGAAHLISQRGSRLTFYRFKLTNNHRGTAE